jgi:hypothetical protein
MSRESTTPSYIVTDANELVTSVRASSVLARFRVLSEQVRILRCSFVGAYFASLFKAHPWLDTLSVTFKAEFQLSDEGQCYRSIKIEADENSISQVANLALPSDHFPGGLFDASVAVSVIDDDLSNGDEDELYTALVNDYDTDTLTLVLSRDAIKPLLSRRSINGAEALRRLLPEYASLLDRRAA